MEGLLQPTHLFFILLIVLIIFGPGKLPDLGRGLGKGIREFKEAMRGGMAEVQQTPVRVAISPAAVTLAVNNTQQFNASVAGAADTGLTWKVNGVAGGDSTVGTIAASGLYTAPSSVPSPSTVTVTAVSQANVSESASATVTIAAAA
ncbi:MAG TPA: twin-arginine translocase TatA/TatE family subunit [Terriglobia bacterium]|nr:twin-arginine translocase TatA/TatE family subunit [Terriglobia bacterium]